MTLRLRQLRHLCGGAVDHDVVEEVSGEVSKENIAVLFLISCSERRNYRYLEAAAAFGLEPNAMSQSHSSHKAYIPQSWCIVDVYITACHKTPPLDYLVFREEDCCYSLVKSWDRRRSGVAI